MIFHVWNVWGSSTTVFNEFIITFFLSFLLLFTSNSLGLLTDFLVFCSEFVEMSYNYKVWHLCNLGVMFWLEFSHFHQKIFQFTDWLLVCLSLFLRKRWKTIWFCSVDNFSCPLGHFLGCFEAIMVFPHLDDFRYQIWTLKKKFVEIESCRLDSELIILCIYKSDNTIFDLVLSLIICLPTV